MDLKTRRRAIYTGMRPYFDEPTLLEIMTLWQAKYSDKPKFAFTEFLSETCKARDVRSQRAQILSSIFKALDLPEKDLLPDPFDRLSQFDSADEMSDTAVALSECDQTTLMFMRFFDALMTRLSPPQQASVRRYLLTHIKPLTLDERRLTYLRDWLDQRAETLRVQFAIPEMRMLVNLAYIAMCELLGPVKADQLLALTIKELEAEASAVEVKLHDFL
ncbi:MAG TPA: hypothetical protein VGD04_08680 [Methylophilus sp.]